MKSFFNNCLAILVGGTFLLLSASSCNDYLDIVPDDGIPTVDMSFNMRATAIKWLYSCYSYMTADGNFVWDPSLTGGDEIWTNAWTDPVNYTWQTTMFNISLGLQNSLSPWSYDWNQWYQGIRYCNTLIERINEVPDMRRQEAEQWIAEAKTLKAYLHFTLIRKWGPIPIVRESKEVFDGVEDVRVYRDPIDDCFNYCLQLLDEAIPYLPERPLSRNEWGRIDKPMAAALKAKIAVTAASPLYNGNKDQSSLVDNRGVRLFPDKTEAEIHARWEEAMNACKEAIDICHSAGKKLYYYNGNLQLNDTLRQELHIREAICDDWNDEAIWVNTQQLGASAIRQVYSCPNIAVDTYPDHPINKGYYFNAPMKIADQFYTKNGLPVENDKERASVNPTDIREITSENRWQMKEGYSTAEFNFDREPRFYADLGFDGSLWFGPSKNNPSPSEISWLRRGANINPPLVGPTGYYIKKLVSYEMRMVSNSDYSTNLYQWTFYRLADLYLLYAEAINEAEGPNGTHSAELFEYLDAVRERAGIPDVKTSWDSWSNAPGYYNTQVGMREIIHRERLNELAFEGHRFWDIRRWKTAPAEYAKGIYGWNQSNVTNRTTYYKVMEVYKQKPFMLKDYFWPISDSDLEVNPNLVQNIGW